MTAAANDDFSRDAYAVAFCEGDYETCVRLIAEFYVDDAMEDPRFLENSEDFEEVSLFATRMTASDFSSFIAERCTECTGNVPLEVADLDGLASALGNYDGPNGMLGEFLNRLRDNIVAWLLMRPGDGWEPLSEWEGRNKDHADYVMSGWVSTEGDVVLDVITFDPASESDYEPVEAVAVATYIGRTAFGDDFKGVRVIPCNALGEAQFHDGDGCVKPIVPPPEWFAMD